MAETTGVVLLFDDADLGAHLREALLERGANLVHEGGLGDLSRDLLERVGADVVVINFDDEDDAAFDRLEQAIEGDHPRVVINDAQASRALDGWDRARWARHLAAKVLAAGDLDPPRPADAAEPAAAPPATSSALAVDDAITVAEPITPPDELPLEEVSEAGVAHEREAAAESESLEAELEALLSADPLPLEDDVGTGLNYAIADAPSQLNDGDFLDAPAVADTLSDSDDFDKEVERLLAEDAASQPPPEDLVPASPVPAAASTPTFSLDSLSLVDMDAVGPPPLPGAPDVAPSAGATRHDARTYQAPDSWSLLDGDSATVEAGASDTGHGTSTKVDPAEFGIEKMSASDFLAPEADQAMADHEPRMTLELMSMEDAIAPQAFEASGSEASGNEMLLDSLGSALTRVVLLGGTVDSLDSVCEFLGLLPADMRATIVHIQHLGGRSTDELALHLSGQCALPVRVAQKGQLARAGEVLVVPPESELRLTRDGKIELRPAQDMGASSPSIDTTFTAAANSFGRDALAILFAGQANDAVAGCQAIHDRGGRVWVEESSGEHFADMVSGVLAEQLADYSGAPAALAARLVEEY